MKNRERITVKKKTTNNKLIVLKLSKELLVTVSIAVSEQSYIRLTFVGRSCDISNDSYYNNNRVQNIPRAFVLIKPSVRKKRNNSQFSSKTDLIREKTPRWVVTYIPVLFEPIPRAIYRRSENKTVGILNRDSVRNLRRESKILVC